MAGVALYNYPATAAACSFPGGNFADSNPICDWTYRYPVTIDHTKVAADLTNYLLYVDLSDLPSAFFTNVKVDGSDIRVTKSDGSTELAHYVGSIDDITETGTLWVRYDGTFSSTVDTVIYIYFGNASASGYATTATYGRNNTYQDYEAFWDFEQDPSGAAPQLNDLTGNGNNGTSQGSMTSGDLVAGKIGDAWDFDGSNDYAACGTGLAFGNGTTDQAFSVSAWVYMRSVTTFRIVNKQTDISSNTEWILGVNATNKMIFQLYDNTFANRISVESINILSYANTWKHICGTYDGSSSRLGLKVYGDALDITNTTTIVGTYTAMHGDAVEVQVGAISGIPQYANGIQSIIAIRNEELSSDYISTEYANQNTPSTFYTIGTIETS